MNIVKKVAFILLVIGGLNWGLVGLFGYDLVAELLPSRVVDFVYVLVGVSAIISIFTLKSCINCKTENESVSGPSKESVISEEDDNLENNH